MCNQGGARLFPIQAGFAASPDSGPPRRPLIPPTRKDAEVLQQLLDENLPPGLLTMKVQQSLYRPHAAAGVSLVDLTVLEREFALIDSVQTAAAEQVCPELAKRP